MIGGYILKVRSKYKILKKTRFCTKSLPHGQRGLYHISKKNSAFNLEYFKFQNRIAIQVSFSPQTKLILYKSKKWGGVMTERTSRFCFKLSNYTILVNFNLSQDSEFESLPSLLLPNPLQIRAYSIIKYTVIYF